MRSLGNVFGWVGVLALLGSGVAWGQASFYDVVYRPATARYFVIETPHFEVIFSDGTEAEARTVAALLERQLPDVQAYVGSTGRRFRMPVVLNGYNDLANGYVTPLPFKQEIEVGNSRSGSLSPRFPSWLHTVAPHELVHAVHADVQAGWGVGAVMRVFGPDLARSFNLWLPSGFAEGAAVHYESGLAGKPGRLNYAPFRMEFRAAFHEGRPWSLAQMLERPVYTRPFDRFYHGGAHLFRFLADRDARVHGDSLRFFRRTTRFHQRMPFLGYGVSLWYGTGVWPATLARRFRQSVRAAEDARRAALGPPPSVRVIASGPGQEHRRPAWLDDGTLVAYASGYALRPGFYRFDAETGRRTLLSAQRTTEDRLFSLTADRAALLYSRYITDPLVSGQRIAEVFRLDVGTGAVTRLTYRGRAFAPTPDPSGGVWAFRQDGQYQQWVGLMAGRAAVPFVTAEGVRYVMAEASPDGAQAAVVANVAGRQGLYRVRLDADEAAAAGTDAGTPRLEPWLGFADASVYDLAWSPDGRFLLFTADAGGVGDLFVLDVETDHVGRLTHTDYGAMEPRLSPDGQTLAFIRYRHERHDLVTMPFRPEAAEPVPADLLAPPPMPTPPPTAEEADTGGAARPYRAWAHLRPRMLFPTLHYETPTDTSPFDTELGLGLGLGVAGTDPLERWSFNAEAFVQKSRLWGEAQLRTSAVAVRPSLRAFALPSTVRVGVRDADGTVRAVRVGRERRGVELGLSLPVTLASNVFQTSAVFALRGSYRQDRLFDDDRRALTGFTNRITLQPGVGLGYRLQTNARDLLPNTGLTLTSLAELDLAADAGTPRQALLTRLNAYLPWLRRHNTTLRLDAGMLNQNQASIYNLDAFLPRGYADVLVGRGTHLRYGLTVLQPLWYIDDGFFILPVYFKALYLYGFAETFHDAQQPAERLTSVGGGLGLSLRVFYLFNLNVRVGQALRVEERRWETVFR